MGYTVGIICAGESEIAPFFPHIENPEITEKAMLQFCEGNIHQTKVVALHCGMCKVNAALATQILIDQYGVNLVINAGAAGGMDPALEVFDVVVATEVAYHDVDASILTQNHPRLESVYFRADPALLALAKAAADKLDVYRVFFGRMVTGEQFITDAGRQEINERFAPLTVDMETASIAHVCHVNRVPFLSIRSVTDTAEHSGMGTFEENCARASAIAKDVVLALLTELE